MPDYPEPNMPTVTTGSCVVPSEVVDPVITRENCLTGDEPNMPEQDSFYWNEPQEVTVECPEGQVGSTVTKTAAAGAYSSTVSVADANAIALAAITAEAEAELECQYPNTEQTATCPDGYTGTPVTIPAGTYRADTQEEADSLALAAAEAALDCTLTPDNFTEPVLDTNMGATYSSMDLPRANEGSPFYPEANYEAAAVFPAANRTVGRIGLTLSRINPAQTGDIWVQLWSDSGSHSPGSLLADSVAQRTENMPWSPQAEVIFDLTESVAVSAGTTYWVVLKCVKDNPENPFDLVSWWFATGSPTYPDHMTHDPTVGWFPAAIDRKLLAELYAVPV